MSNLQIIGIEEKKFHFISFEKKRQSVTQNAHMVVREQLWGTGSFLLFGSQRLDSGHMAWQQVPLCTELSCWALMHRKHFFFKQSHHRKLPRVRKRDANANERGI